MYETYIASMNNRCNRERVCKVARTVVRVHPQTIHKLEIIRQKVSLDESDAIVWGDPEPLCALHEPESAI